MERNLQIPAGTVQPLSRKTCIQEKPLFKGANASKTLHLLPSLNEHLYSREIFGILVVLPECTLSLCYLLTLLVDFNRLGGG